MILLLLTQILMAICPMIGKLERADHVKVPTSEGAKDGEEDAARADRKLRKKAKKERKAAKAAKAEAEAKEAALKRTDPNGASDEPSRKRLKHDRK